MPWCPICKIEYSDGITTCANCKETLTDSLDNTVQELDSYELAQLEEKATAIRLVKYLNYSGIQNADIITDSESKCYRILVTQSDKKSALKHYKAFLEVEKELSLQATSIEDSTDTSEEAELLTEEDSSTSDEDPSDYDVYVRDEVDSTVSDVDVQDNADSSDSDLEIQEDYPSTNYEETEASLDEESDEIEEDFSELEDSSGTEDLSNLEEFNDFEEFNQEHSEDNEEGFVDSQNLIHSSTPSSAYVLKKDAYKEHRSSASMFFAFSIGGLIFLGLNVAGIIQFVNGLFSYLVMGAMFVAFFVLGIYSLRKAKEISTGIDAENELTQKINSYLESIGDISTIDESDWSGLNDELLYFKRTTKLKQMVQQKFGHQNEAYLDVIIEEFYNENV